MKGHRCSPLNVWAEQKARVKTKRLEHKKRGKTAASIRVIEYCGVRAPKYSPRE